MHEVGRKENAAQRSVFSGLKQLPWLTISRGMAELSEIVVFDKGRRGARRMTCRAQGAWTTWKLNGAGDDLVTLLISVPCMVWVCQGMRAQAKTTQFIVTTDIEAQIKQVLSEGLESNAWLIASYPLAEASACKTLPPVMLLLEKKRMRLKEFVKKN